jgi:hypothetical protein
MDVEEFVGTVGGEEIRGYPTDDTPLESQNMFWDSNALSGLFGLC